MKIFSVLISLLATTALTAGPYKIELVQLNAVNTLVVKSTVAPDQVGQTIGQNLQKVAMHMHSEGIGFTEPPFSRYFRYEPTLVEMEVGFPVQTAVAGKGEILASTLPAGDAVMTIHVGSFDKIGEAYDALHAWIKDNGKSENGAPWEVYTSAPDATPESMQTFVYYPVK